MKTAILRSVWGFFAFLPFCYLWGVNSFTWFAAVGTLYFIPIHILFDRLIKNDDKKINSSNGT